MSTNLSEIRPKFTWPYLAMICLIIFIVGSFLIGQVSAFDYPKLSNRSLYIDNVSPGANTSYRLSWRYPSPTTIGSVKFVLCLDGYVLDPCASVPPGDLSGAVLNSQSGITGFSILSQSNGEIVMSKTPGAASTVQSTYTFNNVVNPTGLPTNFYIQIFTYPTADASGSPNYISSVTNATTEPIVINAEVPPILYFCAALTVDDWCENVNGNFIDYGALDPANGHSATSQFGVATNAVGGYVVTVNGKTMTSGNKNIEALSVPTPYNTGEAQFGINLRANTSPALGQDAFGDGIGVITADYSYPDQFKYADGDTIAMAATGSLFNTYTVTYILNLPPDQPSGVYNTTIAYICTASF